MAFLNGWKTKIGGVVQLCGAIYFAYNKQFELAAGLFATAMTTFGLGGKAQKIIDGLNALKDAQK